MPRKRLPSPTETPDNTASPDQAEWVGIDVPKEALQEATGSSSQDVGVALVASITRAMWKGEEHSIEDEFKTMTLAMASMLGLKPRDEAEGIVVHWQVSSRTAKRDIASLKDRGLIRYLGSHRRGFYVASHQT